MGQYLLEMFGISLLLTLLLELPAVWVMGLRQRKTILLGILVNLLTNPAAVYLHLIGIPQIPIEIVVITVEAVVYGWFSRDENWRIPHPVRLAVIANLISWSIGYIVQ